MARTPAKEARVDVRHRIRASADVIGSEVVLNAAVRDLSLGGCQLAGPAWEQVGTRLEIVVSFPDLQTHQALLGIVVHGSDSRMGIRFDAVQEEQRWALRKHIEACEKKRATRRQLESKPNAVTVDDPVVHASSDEAS